MDAMTDFVLQSYNADAVNRVNAVLSTSLMTADTLEYSAVDTWNHPKIPRIDALESDDAKNSTNWQWFDVAEGSTHQTYASLTGVGIVNLIENATANFTIPYQYLYYNCALSPSTNASNSMAVNKYLIQLQNDNLLDGPGMILNETSWTSFMARGFFVWGIIANQTAEKLLYGSEFFSGSLYLFECSMNSVAVEANIICNSNDCRTKRVRRLKSPKPVTGTGMTWDAAHRYYTFDRVLRHFVSIGGDDPINAGNVVRNPVDLFIYGSTPWGKELSGVGSFMNWTEYVVNPSLSDGMSRRLTKLMNTYWDASRWPLAITRNDPYGMHSMNETSGEAYEVMTMNKTDALLTFSIPIYKVNKPWAGTLIVCSTILFLVGLTSFVLSFSAHAPDIFNYVSSFTRDNPYIKIPQGGTFLDGAERARLLRNLPVQLGDVNPMEDTGYVAMKSVDGKKMVEQGRIRKGRLYF